MKEKNQNKNLIEKVCANKNLVTYFGILLVTFLMCQNFLQMHFSSDTYVLYDLGYMNYPQKYFLLDGRLISTVICYLAGILKIPIPAYIIGMDFIGIVFIATAIYLMYKILKNIIKPKNKIIDILLIASCFVLILNQFTLEYLLFPESAVMCLGVLLSVIAAGFIFKEDKLKYLKIALLLLLVGICYQGELNIFPILAIIVYIVKHICEEKSAKSSLKEFFIDMIKFLIILAVVLLICTSIVKLNLKLLNSKQDRNMHLIDLEAVYLRWTIIVEYLDELWVNCMHMLPKFTTTITLVLSFALLICLKPKKEVFIEYVLLVLVVFTSCILPMFKYNTGICARVNLPLMMIWGASLVVLLAQANKIDLNKKIISVVYIFVLISFIVNTMFIMQNITEHIASNRVEDNMGKTIKYALEKYEEESGNKVTKFGYIYDENPQQHATGIKPMQSLTERKLACSWSIFQTVNYYCERKFERTIMPMDMYHEKIGYIKDYKEFSEEQIIFDGDAMYLIVY